MSITPPPPSPPLLSFTHLKLLELGVGLLFIGVLPQTQVEDEELSVAQPAFQLFDLALQLSQHAFGARREEGTGIRAAPATAYVFAQRPLMVGRKGDTKKERERERGYTLVVEVAPPPI